MGSEYFFCEEMLGLDGDERKEKGIENWGIYVSAFMERFYRVYSLRKRMVYLLSFLQDVLVHFTLHVDAVQRM